MTLPTKDELGALDRRYLESKINLAEKYLLARLYYEVKMLREVVKTNPPKLFASSHCPHCFRDFPHAADGETCAFDFHERQIIEPVLNSMKLLDADMPLNVLGEQL